MRGFQEVEAKLTVSADDFANLCRAGRVVQQLDQLNVYYDCDGRLAANRATLRFRFAPGTQPTIAFKLPKNRRGSVRTSLELEFRSDECAMFVFRREIDVSTHFPPEIASLLGPLGIEAVRRLGWMRTIRHVLVLPDGGHVEADKVKLPNGAILYEVEVEIADPMLRQRTVRAVKRIAHSATPSHLSKFERFMAATDTGK